MTHEQVYVQSCMIIVIHTVNRELTLSIVHMYMTTIPTGFLRFYFESTQLIHFFFGTRDVGLTNPLLGNLRA